MSNPEYFLTAADRASRHAAAVRGKVAELARAGAACAWDGAAARRFRGDVPSLLHRLRCVALTIDDAAEALRRHAAALPAELAQQRATWRAEARAVQRFFGDLR